MKTRSLPISLALCLALAAALLPATNFAQQMNYQGRLTDSSGNALADGQYTLTFDLYDAPTGGNQAWGPFVYDGGSGDGHGPKADLVNGRFNVILGPNDGSARALSGAFAGARYLQITVAGAPPLLPRQQILSAPDALHAINADHATIADGINGSLNITANFTVGGNSTFSGSVTTPGVGSFGSITAGTAELNTANIPGIADFGSSSRQMISLMEAALMELASKPAPNISGLEPGLPWFRGGSHNNSANNAGAGGKTLMTLDNNGLSVFGETQFTVSFQNTNKGPNVSFAGWGTTGDWYLRSSANNGSVVIQDSGGQTKIGGWVGIGGSADFPLHVTSTRSYSFNTGVGDLRNYGGGIWQHNSDDDHTPYSIVADGLMFAVGFQATSDRRIKEIVGASEPARDLATVEQLKVTDYHFIDRVTKGGKLQKGFIAQDVQAIIPEAVSASPSFIPDIFAHASALKFDEATKTLKVSLEKAHQLKAGDRVRLVSKTAEIDLTVDSTPTDREFIVAKCESDPGPVFVYGKYVTDLLNVNYDRIFTTGISAIQELAKRVKILEENQRRIVELEQKAERVDALGRELAQLKAMVANLGHQTDDLVTSHNQTGQVRDFEPLIY